MLISYLVLKKSKQFLKRTIHNKYEYYGLVALIFLSAKTLVGLITLSALVEIYPPLNTEANIAAYTLIVLGILWTIVISYYNKPLSQYSKRLPMMLIQNVILLLAFFINLMVHIKNGQGFPDYLILLSPLIINFIANIVTIQIYKTRRYHT